MKNLMLAAGLIFLTGCNPIKGVFTITEPITLKVTELIEDTDPCDPEEGGCFNPPPKKVEKNKRFTPRQESAELEFESKEKLVLNFEIKKKEYKVKFKIPDGMSIPKHHGTFSLTAQQIGQPYGLEGVVDTEYSRSAGYSEYERCEIRRERRICEPRRRPPRDRDRDRGERGRHDRLATNTPQDCRWEIIIIPGRQYVEYHYEYETRNVYFDLVDGDSSVANFSGSSTSSDKVYDFIGQCRRR